jgi:hypothetical protein
MIVWCVTQWPLSRGKISRTRRAGGPFISALPFHFSFFVVPIEMRHLSSFLFFVCYVIVNLVPTAANTSNK